MLKSAYTFGGALRLPVHEARPLVEAALKAEGFGVLTEIDVAATLEAKLGIEQAPYLILGACNPALAHRALQAIHPSVRSFPATWSSGKTPARRSSRRWTREPSWAWWRTRKWKRWRRRPRSDFVGSSGPSGLANEPGRDGRPG